MRNNIAYFEKSISNMVIISKKIYVEFIFALGFSKEAILFLIYLLADKGKCCSSANDLLDLLMISK